MRDEDRSADEHPLGPRAHRAQAQPPDHLRQDRAELGSCERLADAAARTAAEGQIRRAGRRSTVEALVAELARRGEGDWVAVRKQRRHGDRRSRRQLESAGLERLCESAQRGLRGRAHA
jgi:hypothetical protein